MKAPSRRIGVVRTNSIHDPRYQKIIGRLVQARVDAALSQSELATLTGLRQSDISKIEHSQRRIDILEAVDWIRCTKSKDLAVIAQTFEDTNA